MPLSPSFSPSLRQSQALHVVPLEIHGGMNIAVQRQIHRGMAQNFRQAFRIKSQLHAAGGKGVAQGVEGRACDPAGPGCAGEMMLHGARLRYGRPGYKISPPGTRQGMQKPHHIRRERDGADRIRAFRRGDDDAGSWIFSVQILDTLSCAAHMQQPLRKGEVAGFIFNAFRQLSEAKQKTTRYAGG